MALEERAVAHRLVGEAAFFQRAEIRDVLAWLRLLADPSDAGAVVRALARPPIELRSVDIARCTQIARRRKLDMVAALAAATESPQVPPEARERIRVFLKLYRSAVAAIDTTRPDLYVHRLIDRLGLRRQQLFAAQPDVVERLRALARFGELASAYVRRAPQATPREFARSIAAVADFGLREEEEPALSGAAAVQVLTLAGGRRARGRRTCTCSGCSAGVAAPAPEAVPDELLHEPLPPDSEENRRLVLRQALYAAITRARTRVVLGYPAGDRPRHAARGRRRCSRRSARRSAREWDDQEEELFGPAETLHATYRLLRDELLEGDDARRRPARRAALRHRPRRLPRRRPLPGAAQGRGADRPPRGAGRRRGPARRQRPDPPGGHRRAARDLHLLGARRLPARRRARRPPPRPGDRRARRAVARAVPAQARRGRRAVGLGHRHVPRRAR